MGESALIFLDRQHSGKPHQLGDRGAWGAAADFDHDGRPDVNEGEAFLTGPYLWHTEVKSIELGHAVLPVTDGWYSARHARVNGYAASSGARFQAYIAAHVNAGGGRDGRVYFDDRSEMGELLARCICDRLRLLPELNGAQALAASPSVHSAPFNTIAGIFAGKACGVCFEPAFIDQPAHAPLFTPEGLKRIGYALAFGIHDYVQRRSRS